MLKRLSRLLISSLLLTSLVAVPVLAEDTSTSTDTDSTTTTTDEDQPETEDQKTARFDRIEKVKDKLQEKLTDAQENRLKERCGKSQQTLGSLHSKLKTNVPKRNRSFEELVKHIDDLIPKLQAKGIATTEIEAERTTLADMISKFKTDVDTYKQSLSDLKLIDCATDPTGFKAALEDARTLRASLSQQLEDIFAFVKNTVKPTLVDLHNQVELTETESEKEETN